MATNPPFRYVVRLKQVRFSANGTLDKISDPMKYRVHGVEEQKNQFSKAVCPQTESRMRLSDKNTDIRMNMSDGPHGGEMDGGVPLVSHRPVTKSFNPPHP